MCNLETSRIGAAYIYDISSVRVNDLTFILLTWRKWLAPNNASKQQMGFNSGFKGLMNVTLPEIFFCACLTIVKTDSEACPLSYSVGTEVLLSGLSGQGIKLITCHYQVSGLGMSGAIPLLAICAFMACSGSSLPLLSTFYTLLYYA